VEIRMKKFLFDRIDLPAFQDGIRRPMFRDIELQDRVASRFRPQHFVQRLGINGNGNVLALTAVDNSRNETFATKPPRGVLAAIGSALSTDYYFRHKIFPLFSVEPTGRIIRGQVGNYLISIQTTVDR